MLWVFLYPYVCYNCNHTAVSNPLGHPHRVYVELWRVLGRLTASLLYQLNFIQQMPKFDEIRANANNSTIPSTSNRTKAISLSVFDASNIVCLANDLHGEEALENVSLLLFDTSDEQMRGIALESILKFYASVRLLTKSINEAIKFA